MRHAGGFQYPDPSDDLCARAAHAYARRATDLGCSRDRQIAAEISKTPLTRFLDTVEHGEPDDILAELELHRCRALLGDDTLLDPALEFLA